MPWDSPPIMQTSFMQNCCYAKLCKRLSCKQLNFVGFLILSCLKCALVLGELTGEVAQLNGTFNVSDNSNSDWHSYLDLAGTNIIPYRMSGQKQRHDENERANTNKCSALKDYTQPNTKVKIQRQKVPDDEDIDINKIVKVDKPKDDRNSATKTEKQYKEKKAKRLVLEMAKRIQIQKDMKDKEAKRFAIEKAQIKALIEKHRPHTLKTPDKVSTLGTGKNAKVDGRDGTEK